MTNDEAWKIFHKGEKASKDELRRALLCVLQSSKYMEERLAHIAPLIDPLEEFIRGVIEERLKAVSL